MLETSSVSLQLVAQRLRPSSVVAVQELTQVAAGPGRRASQRVSNLHESFMLALSICGPLGGQGAVEGFFARTDMQPLPGTGAASPSMPASPSVPPPRAGPQPPTAHPQPAPPAPPAPPASAPVATAPPQAGPPPPTVHPHDHHLRPPHGCLQCHKSLAFVTFVLCGGCLAARYCTSACHNLHWPTHQHDCRLRVASSAGTVTGSDTETPAKSSKFLNSKQRRAVARQARRTQATVFQASVGASRDSSPPPPPQVHDMGRPSSPPPPPEDTERAVDASISRHAASCAVETCARAPTVTPDSLNPSASELVKGQLVWVVPPARVPFAAVVVASGSDDVLDALHVLCDGQVWVVQRSWCTAYRPTHWSACAANAAVALRTASAALTAEAPGSLVPAPTVCDEEHGPTCLLPYTCTKCVCVSAGVGSVVDPAVHQLLVDRHLAMHLVVQRSELLLSSFVREVLADGGGICPGRLGSDLHSYVKAALRVSNPYAGNGKVELCPLSAQPWANALHRLNSDFPLSPVQLQLLQTLQGASGALERVSDHVLEVRLRQLTAESLRSLMRTHLTLSCGVAEADVDRLLDMAGDTLSASTAGRLSHVMYTDTMGWSAAQVRVSSILNVST